MIGFWKHKKIIKIDSDKGIYFFISEYYLLATKILQVHYIVQNLGLYIYSIHIWIKVQFYIVILLQ